MSNLIQWPQGPIADPQTGYLSLEWQQWLQNPQLITINLSVALGVTSGGTGLTSGTSGGVLAFTASDTIASSALLTNHAIVLGGGAGAVPSTPLGLGTTTTVLHGNASGAPTWGAVVLTTDVSGILPVANGGTGNSAGASPITNSLSGNVALNNTGTYFDGPSVAQGTSGTWFASGNVNVNDSAGGAAFNVKLWDGTTVMASARTVTPSASSVNIAIAGYIASPQGNIRISVNDATAATGSINFNSSGNSKDSTITAIRIA